VGLADAAGTEPQDALAGVEEAELCEVQDLLAVERGLALEVVVLQALDLGEAGGRDPLAGSGLGTRQHLGFHDAAE
jgi:hypothetical protein